MKPALLVVATALLLAGCGAAPSAPARQAAAPAAAQAAKKNVFEGLKVTKAFHQDTIYEVLYGKLKDGRSLSMNNVDGMYVDLGDDTDVRANPAMAKQLAAALDACAAAEKNATRAECIRHLATDLRADIQP